MVRLAREYGTPPDELDMSLETFALHLAEEPWGDARADYRAALQTQHQYALKGQRLATANAILKFNETEEQTPEEKHKELQRRAFAVFGGG
jgi:hypothetical protein